jgi:hypothetical protein
MNTNPVKDTNINIRLSSYLKADLIAAAESEHLTLSDFVIAVFEQHLSDDYSPDSSAPDLETALNEKDAVLQSVKQQLAATADRLHARQTQVAAYDALALPFASLIGTTYTHKGKIFTINTAFDALKAVSLHTQILQK